MNRRVLVTGGAGFIGSHVVDALLAAGDEPHVLDDLSKGQVTNLATGVPLHVLDIATGPLDRLFREVQFDAIIHCAAQTNVMRSLADPELDRQINVVGLERVLDAAKAQRTRRFVFISSGGAVYGETPVPASERTTPHPDNPYGEHKLDGERAVLAAPIPSAILRPSNVYGARQRSDAEGGVISIFAERLLAGLPLEIYGDGEQERDFIDVSDVVAAVMLALNDPAMGGVWNVGTGVPTTITEVARLMTHAFEGSHELLRLPARQEIRRSCLDVTRLRSTGRWTPRRDLQAGVSDLARALRPAVRET